MGCIEHQSEPEGNRLRSLKVCKALTGLLITRSARDATVRTNLNLFYPWSRGCGRERPTVASASVGLFFGAASKNNGGKANRPGLRNDVRDVCQYNSALDA